MRKYLAIVVFSVLLVGVVSQVSAGSYGPGAHWVDTATTTGTDFFPDSFAEFGIDWMMDGNLDEEPDFDARFEGPFTVNRTIAMDDSLNYPGSRTIDDHYDVIDTEIWSMRLVGVGAATGMTLRAGLGAGVSTPSLGAIVEQPGDNSLADSFFDVFFEIDTEDGTLHNIAALRIMTVLDRVPPPAFTDYDVWDLGLPLELYAENGEHVANLTELTTGGSGHHKITPSPSGLISLVSLGAAGFLPYFWRRRKRAA